MSIEATLKELRRHRGEWRFTIVYTNTVTGNIVEISGREANLTQKGLRNIARRQAELLANNQTTDIDIPIGTTIDVTPDPVIPPDPPTQDEIVEAAWFADWAQLNQLIDLTSAVPALATAQATVLMTTLRTNLESGWKNSYLGKIR